MISKREHKTFTLAMQEIDHREIPVIKSVTYSKFPDLVFGISTRIGGVSSPPYGLNLSYKVGDNEESVNKNRELFFGQVQVPLNSLAIPGQVHGNKIARVDQPGKIEQCDGLVTGEKNVYLAVSVADCLPIFLYDPVHHAVAAIHSGWKGSKLKILSLAVRRMVNEFDTQPAQLLALIGQSAGVCCYEVGEDVAGQFGDEYVERSPGKKPHLNLKKYNRDLLSFEGLGPGNIEIVSDCTICNPEKYHSYRRDGAISGRMMGVIGLKSDIS
jgi:YfiH family protein